MNALEEKAAVITGGSSRIGLATAERFLEGAYVFITGRRQVLDRKTQLEHVHRCPQCGHVVKGDEIPYQSIISGVITCPKCEWSGPINIQIVPEELDTV